MRADNPVHGVIRFADGKRERRLSDDEYAALGAALGAAERKEIWPAAVAATRFLALTGWRKGEALGLRWAEVDLARRTATLADSKTGRSIRPLSHAAYDVLRALPRMAGELVFPATRGDGRMSGFPKLWARIAKLGALPADVTPHVLRHSRATWLLQRGVDPWQAAGHLGMTVGTLTRTYGHHSPTWQKDAAEV